MTYPSHIRVLVPMRVPTRSVSRPVPAVSPMEHLTIPIRRETRTCAIAHSDLIKYGHPSGLIAELFVEAHFAIEEKLYGVSERVFIGDRVTDTVSVAYSPVENLKIFLRWWLINNDLWWGWIKDTIEPKMRKVPCVTEEYWEKHYHGIIPVAGE